MKLPKKISRICTVVGAALLINQVALPLGLLCNPIYKSRIEAKSEIVNSYRNLPSYFDSLDYVNLANSIVNNDSTGKGDCKDYAIETYNTYQKLVAQNARDDLKDGIRMVLGITSMGHVWLEVEVDGEFKPYETTSDTIPLTTNPEIKQYSRHSLEEKMKIDGGEEKGVWIIGRSFNGSKIVYPTVRSLFYPGGAARMIYLGRN